MIIHQLLHGYKRGHQLLSGSMQLDTENLELVTRLSDLSGSMTFDTEIHPYLTCYPLPGRKFFAVAKTWMDEKAPRTGCVLTHTLLVPIETWMNFPNPIDLHCYFRKPESSNDTDIYINGLEIDVSSPSKIYPRVNLDKNAISEFIYRYFSEGITPIIWFTEEDQEDFFWKLSQSMWPLLRSQFSCCTLCLQPRYLDDKPFDLMFTPSSTFTRFQQLSQENIIEQTNLIFSEPKLESYEETWINQWTDQILGISTVTDNFQSDIQKELAELGPYLSADPTVIKKIFLIRELRKRSISSPLAAVGLLDMVESIAQDDSAAIKYKEDALLIAIQSIHQENDKGERLRCLVLISDRLKRKAFKKINSGITSKYYASVAENFFADPISAIDEVERLVGTSIESPNTPFVIGIASGLLKGGAEFPNYLKILRQYQEASPLLIGIEPSLGLMYLKCYEFDEAESTVLDDLVTWISKISDSEILSHVRKVILPEIKANKHKSILDALLRELSEEDIYWIMDTLSISTDGFMPSQIRGIICDKVSMVFPRRLREWALQTDQWSDELAEIVAYTYPLDVTGIREVTQTAQYNFIKRAQILSAIIIDITHNHHLPQWFQEFATTNLELLPSLLINVEILPDNVLQAIQLIFNEVRELPIARSFQLQDINPNLYADKYPFSIGLASSSMRSVITCYIKGDIDWETYQIWESTNWGIKWISNVGVKDLQLILNRNCVESEDAWLRGWKWLSNASENLYQNNSRPPQKLIINLLSTHKGSWLEEVTGLWVSIIRRLSTQSKKQIYIQACADALNFSFNNSQYPVSVIVIETFFPIYSEVIESENISFEANNLFGYFEWDKGKELRKKIIDSFINSKWPPGDLVISTRNQTLLRKIYSRLKRHRGGKEYIQSITRDLMNRKDDPEISDILNDFLSLTQQQNYYELWD